MTKQFQLKMTKLWTSVFAPFLSQLYKPVVLKYFSSSYSCTCVLLPPHTVPTRHKPPTSKQPVPKHKSPYHCSLSRKPLYLLFKTNLCLASFPIQQLRCAFQLANPLSFLHSRNHCRFSLRLCFYTPKGIRRATSSAPHAGLYPFFFPLCSHASGPLGRAKWGSAQSSVSVTHKTVL